MADFVTGLLVAFLLLVVLIMQIQINALARRIDEAESIISEKIDELVKEKESKPKP